mmetsp:Transcript_18033/g.45451  ORF Transcript_18033/g.45451 Transcript_18033/m.45451 type:complete len:220 (-) Transcript_18033:497-1156(-)
MLTILPSFSNPTPPWAALHRATSEKSGSLSVLAVVLPVRPEIVYRVLPAGPLVSATLATSVTARQLRWLTALLFPWATVWTKAGVAIRPEIPPSPVTSTSLSVMLYPSSVRTAYCHPAPAHRSGQRPSLPTWAPVQDPPATLRTKAVLFQSSRTPSLGGIGPSPRGAPFGERPIRSASPVTCTPTTPVVVAAVAIRTLSISNHGFHSAEARAVSLRVPS